MPEIVFDPIGKGLARVEFLRALAQIGVSAINLRDEEVEAEIQAAREMAA
jgi:hypothetical protein